MYAYFGSDHFSLTVLESLLVHASPCLVVTQPDRPQGRRQKLQQGPLARLAAERGLPLFQPESFREEASRHRVLECGAKVFIVVSFGQILPQSLIGVAPPIINGHASLLPRYRGASPIQSVLLAGETRTGMSVMHIVRELDAGPVIAQEAVDILPADNHGTLSAKLAALCGRMLQPYALGAAVPAGTPQDHARATHCHKIEKSACQLRPADCPRADILNRVRAFAPKPGAFLWLKAPGGPVRLKVLEAAPSDMVCLSGGMLRAGRELLLGCADGALRLAVVQPEGRAAMHADAFLNGWQGELSPIEPGAWGAGPEA